MKVTIGLILKEIRIKSGLTLRSFCIKHDLDAVRYSMIERDVLKPDLFELAKYLELIKQKEKIEEVELELKSLYYNALFYCMSCGRVVRAPIFGLFDKRTGALVNIMKGHEEPFTCKPCKERIKLLERRE